MVFEETWCVVLCSDRVKSNEGIVVSLMTMEVIVALPSP